MYEVNLLTPLVRAIAISQFVELKPKRSLSPPPPTIGDRLDVVTKVRRILPKAKTELPPGKSDVVLNQVA